MSALQEKYNNKIKNSLKEQLKFKSIMQVPKLEKVVLNMGVGAASQDKSILDEAVKILGTISGQKPVACAAKKSVAGFKLREGNLIGCKVTLRGKKMYNFLQKLIDVTLPQVKDFRGISSKLDGRGNYTLGWKDHSIFPEINIDEVKTTFGFDICIVTTAKNNEEGLALLKELGFPFKKN